MAATKPAFYSRYNRPETIAAETGTNFDKTYSVIIDNNGHKLLKCTGETDRYAKVQAHKEECLIENILVRASMDPSILEKHKGSYFDATDMPKTLAEAQNKILAVKQEFEKLPVEIRAKFDHSAEKYIQQYGSKEWGEALGIIAEKVAEAETAETKEEKKEEKKDE